MDDDHFKDYMLEYFEANKPKLEEITQAISNSIVHDLTTTNSAKMQDMIEIERLLSFQRWEDKLGPAEDVYQIHEYDVFVRIKPQDKWEVRYESKFYTQTQYAWETPPGNAYLHSLGNEGHLKLTQQVGLKSVWIRTNSEEPRTLTILLWGQTIYTWTSDEVRGDEWQRVMFANFVTIDELIVCEGCDIDNLLIRFQYWNQDSQSEEIYSEKKSTMKFDNFDSNDIEEAKFKLLSYIESEEDNEVASTLLDITVLFGNSASVQQSNKPLLNGSQEVKYRPSDKPTGVKTDKTKLQAPVSQDATNKQSSKPLKEIKIAGASSETSHSSLPGKNSQQAEKANASGKPIPNLEHNAGVPIKQEEDQQIPMPDNIESDLQGETVTKIPTQENKSKEVEDNTRKAYFDLLKKENSLTDSEERIEQQYEEVKPNPTDASSYMRDSASKTQISNSKIQSDQDIKSPTEQPKEKTQQNPPQQPNQKTQQNLKGHPKPKSQSPSTPSSKTNNEKSKPKIKSKPRN